MDNCVHCLKLTKECTCKTKSDSVIYTGPNLLCSAINTNENMTLVIQKLNDAICNTVITTTTAGPTTTSTTTIGILEFNFTNHSVWNNGQGNIDSNTSFGDGALKSNTTGNNNTAYGIGAVGSTTTGTDNTGIGPMALFTNELGSQNTAIGVAANYKNFFGSENTAIGYIALSNAISDTNTAIGSRALVNIYSGGGNIGIGENSGSLINDNTNNTLGDNSIFIGNLTKPLNNGDTNEIVIGPQAIGLGSNTAIIGNSNITRLGFYGVLRQQRTTAWTVSTLPTGVLGDRAYVTDAVSPTFLGALTGGGTIKTPVFHNGAAWVAG